MSQRRERPKVKSAKRHHAWQDDGTYAWHDGRRATCLSCVGDTQDSGNRPGHVKPLRT
jgi:hypothetical protein